MITRLICLVLGPPMVDVGDVIYGAGGWEYAVRAAAGVGCEGEGILVSSGGHVQGVMDGEAMKRLGKEEERGARGRCNSRVFRAV